MEKIELNEIKVGQGVRRAESDRCVDNAPSARTRPP